MRRWTLGAALALAAVGASGCRGLALGSRDRWDWNALAPTHVPARPELRWRARLAELTDLEVRSRARATPVVDLGRGVVYVGGLDRGLHALRISDGTELWRFEMLGDCEGSAVLADGVLYLGSNDGAMYAIDAETGALRWRFATVAEVTRRAVVTEDSVYFANADDTVFALNRSGGTQRWRYRREPPGGITASGYAGIVLSDERIVTGFSDGHVMALSIGDGSVVWDRDTNSDSESAEGAAEAHRLIDVDTTPVMVGGNLFAASHVAGLYAMDPAGGGTRWRNDTLTDISALATDGRDLFAASSSRGVMRIDPSDGTVRWARDLEARGFSELLERGGVLYVPTSDRALWLLRTRDGEPVMGFGDEGVSALPALVGNWMFVNSNRSVLTAWQFPNS